MLKLSKPNAKKAATDRLTVKGCEDVAAEYRALDRQLADTKAQMALAKEEIIAAVQKARAKESDKGRLHTTVLVESSDGHPLPVTYKNSYSKVAIEHREAMEGQLNGHFDELFHEVSLVKVDGRIDMAALEKALGKRHWGTFAPFFKTTLAIDFKADFMSLVHMSRKHWDKSTCAIVDSVIDQQQYAPQITTKVKK